MKRFRFLGRKGWSVVLALFLLALVMSPLAAYAKKKPPPPPPPNQTLQDILSGLPNGQPFQILAEAILFVESQVVELQQLVIDLQQRVTKLEQEVAVLQAQTVETSFASKGNGAIHSIIDNLAPGVKHVRIEVSFVPTVATPPTDTFIMSSLVSPQTATSVNFISINSTGVTAVGKPTSLPAPIATVTGVAQLDAVAGTSGGVGFEVIETSATAGTYFVKVYN